VVGDKNLAEHKSKPVQTEVQYSPEIDWVAYDISYKTKENPEKQGMFHNNLYTVLPKKTFQSCKGNEANV